MMIAMCCGLTKDLYDPTGNGYQQLGGKTPKAIPTVVLAVAILLESRFPQQAFLFGDIERFQVEQMVQWVNAILPTPVVEPICFAGERLYLKTPEKPLVLTMGM